MARGASRVPFCGQKSRGHLKKSRFCARAHLEALSRPHIVIWPGWFYNSKLDLQHSCIGRFMQRFFNSFWALFWFLVHFPPPLYHIWLYVHTVYLAISWRGCGGGELALSCTSGFHISGKGGGHHTQKSSTAQVSCALKINPHRLESTPPV